MSEEKTEAPQTEVYRRNDFGWKRPAEEISAYEKEKAERANAILENRSGKLVGLGIKPDGKYNSMLVSKLVNIIMLQGKKVAATKIVYEALDIISKRIKDKEPLEVLEEAIRRVSPVTEVRSKRVGGQTYQIPREVPPKRQLVLAFRWIKDAFRSKKGRPCAQRLANELMDAYNKQGAAMTKRENVHKMAEANKAFAYYA
ncbi:MAG: 30S ribosomal protein S7 [Planctomycetes bacterium]|nr:30S ribosomal protein S7 [Planctomycetota bacterium]